MISDIVSGVKGLLIRPVWAATVPPTGWSNPAANAGGSPAPATLQDLEFVFSRMTSAVLALGGLIAFFYLLIGGFKYMTAGGDDKAMMHAKNSLTQAFLGLLVVIGAWLILKTLGNVIGYNLLQFEIPR